MKKLVLMLALACLAAAFPGVPAWAQPSKFAQQGIELCNDGKFDQAIEVFNQGLKANPQDAALYDLRGRAYYAKGQNAQAVADHDQAIKLNPKSGEAYKNRAMVHYTLEDYHKAEADLKAAQNLGLKVDPEFVKLVQKKAAGKR
jgi:Flp pilus assembly protein TadD